MQPDDLKRYVREYFASFNADPERAVRAYVEDPHLREHIEMLWTAFPNYKLEAVDILAEGSKVAVRAVFRGVHQGSFFGRPATGREVTLPFIIIYRVANGKIVEHWMEANTLTLLQQIEASAGAD